MGYLKIKTALLCLRNELYILQSKILVPRILGRYERVYKNNLRCNPKKRIN